MIPKQGGTSRGSAALWRERRRGRRSLRNDCASFPGHRARVSRRARGAGWEYAYVAIDDHSRLGFAQMHATETGLSATRFLEQTLAYLPHPGYPGAQHPYRQRQDLRVPQLPRAVPSPSHQAPAHSRLPPPDQRQSRALHPDRAALMGLRPLLPPIPAADPRAAPLAASLQLAQTSWQPQGPSTHQSYRPLRGQRAETPQLKRAFGAWLQSTDLSSQNVAPAEPRFPRRPSDSLVILNSVCLENDGIGPAVAVEPESGR